MWAWIKERPGVRKSIWAAAAALVLATATKLDDVVLHAFKMFVESIITGGY